MRQIHFEKARTSGFTRLIDKFELLIMDDGKCVVHVYTSKVVSGTFGVKRTFKSIDDVKKYLAKEYEMPAKRLLQLIDGQTYDIGKNENGEQYIKCLTCGMKSYHLKDIEHKYCGNCHKFL